jgi:hypothetical protein
MKLAGETKRLPSAEFAGKRKSFTPTKIEKEPREISVFFSKLRSSGGKTLAPCAEKDS